MTGAPAPLVCIAGPTATGKTAIAVAVAERIGGELLNADSRQVLRGLSVATTRPSAVELHGVPCHLLDLCDAGDAFTVAAWRAAAEAAIEGVVARGRRPVVVGGTGLYVSALTEGYDFGGVPPDPAVRAERERGLAEPGGLAALAAELRRRDPATTADLRNPRRVVRALELLDGGGAARSRTPRPAVVVGIDVEAALHRRWISARAAAMLAGGRLEGEVRAALARGVPAEVLARCGIGYAEGLDLVAGDIDIAEAERRIVERTVRYARAQRTWFRPRVDRWVVRSGAARLEDAVEAVLAEVGG